jgi:hypothetical protein
MRPTRTLAALVVSTCLAGLVAASTAPAATQRRDCRTKGKTFAANAEARVFYRLAPGGGGRTYYACDVRRRRLRRIGINGGPGLGISPVIALVGRQVAYEDIICNKDGNCSGSVYRLDVVTGRLKVAATMDADMPPATDLEMSSSGAVYWIRRTAEGYAVVRGAFGGSPTVLENGAGVDRHSLAAAGRRVYWTLAGQPRTFSE